MLKNKNCYRKNMVNIFQKSKELNVFAEFKTMALLHMIQDTFVTYSKVQNKDH